MAAPVLGVAFGGGGEKVVAAPTGNGDGGVDGDAEIGHHQRGGVVHPVLGRFLTSFPTEACFQLRLHS